MDEIRKKLKPSIAKAFRKWEGQSTQKEKKQFCEDVNSMASLMSLMRRMR